MNFSNLKIYIPKIDGDDSHNSKSKMIDKNGHFYHVTQQTCNRINLFSPEAVKYRDFLLKSLCEKNEILTICNVIMPTHTHDVFLAENFSTIQSVMRTLNANLAKFILKERIQENKKGIIKIFDNYPSYERIKTVEHLFYLFKYLYDNPNYLKETGKFVPYSCFNSWEKGYFKPYNESFYKALFGMSIEEITTKCRELSKEEFRDFAHERFGGLEEI